MRQEMMGMQWHQLDHMQTICSSLQTDICTNTSSLNFYRPCALPGTQPTVSKHCLTIKPIKIQLYSVLHCTHWRQEMMGFWDEWHQLDHMQTICTSLQTDNHTNTISLKFYRPYALPDVQLTVSKHWRTIDGQQHTHTHTRLTVLYPGLPGWAG